MPTKTASTHFFGDDSNAQVTYHTRQCRLLLFTKSYSRAKQLKWLSVSLRKFMRRKAEETAPNVPMVPNTESVL